MPRPSHAAPRLRLGLTGLAAFLSLTCATHVRADTHLLETADEPAEASRGEAGGCVNELLPEDHAPFEGERAISYAWQASGLGIFDHVEGEGPEVRAGSTPTFDYIGYRLDGCAFDASYLHGPLTAPLEAMIPGMREGLVGMRVGGRRRLFVPPDLAYGDRGAGPLIGPDEVLVFELELLAVP